MNVIDKVKLAMIMAFRRAKETLIFSEQSTFCTNRAVKNRPAHESHAHAAQRRLDPQSHESHAHASQRRLDRPAQRATPTLTEVTTIIRLLLFVTLGIRSLARLFACKMFV